MHLYVIRSETFDLVTVGVVKDPAKRLSSLQKDHPGDTLVLKHHQPVSENVRPGVFWQVFRAVLTGPPRRGNWFARAIGAAVALAVATVEFIEKVAVVEPSQTT